MSKEYNYNVIDQTGLIPLGNDRYLQVTYQENESTGKRSVKLWEMYSTKDGEIGHSRHGIVLPADGDLLDTVGLKLEKLVVMIDKHNEELEKAAKKGGKAKAKAPVIPIEEVGRRGKAKPKTTVNTEEEEIVLSANRVKGNRRNK